MFKLKLILQNLTLKEYTICDGDKLSIGRHLENEIVLTNKNVSRHHASIEAKGQKLLVFDKGSRNGTHVNGIKVKSAQLYDGDVVTISSSVIIKVYVPSSKKKEGTITGEHNQQSGNLMASDP